jgi:hypothetical protein
MFHFLPHDETLILVSDHAGNVLMRGYGRYEFYGLEQISIYIGRRDHRGR